MNEAAETGFSTSPFDVVVVPFPFTERLAAKRRPALVLSTSRFVQGSGHVISAMITTTTLRWPSDIEIADPEAGGLVDGSIVRLKLFTLPVDLILRPLGRLVEQDAASVRSTMRWALADLA